MGDQQDIGAAKETYAGFMSLLKWGTVVTVLTTFIVVMIIASRA